MAPDTSLSNKIPVVELGQLGLGWNTETSQEEWQRVARQLYEAFTDIGCAYLTNHGVPEDQQKELYEAATGFFKLPQDKKELFKFDINEFTGYISVDTEKYSESAHELHESILVSIADAVPHYPETPALKRSIGSFLQSCWNLSSRIMTALSISLEKDKDYFLSMHHRPDTDGSLSVMRLNYYPAVPSTTPKDSTRFGAHNDYSTFTFIFQDNTGGLQVRDRRGSWLDVPYVPGTIIILAGDFIKFYSNNKFNSVMHQVVIPDDQVLWKSPRLSLNFFVHADKNTPMWPLSYSSETPPTVNEYISYRAKKAHAK